MRRPLVIPVERKDTGTRKDTPTDIRRNILPQVMASRLLATAGRLQAMGMADRQAVPTALRPRRRLSCSSSPTSRILV